MPITYVRIPATFGSAAEAPPEDETPAEPDSEK